MGYDNCRICGDKGIGYKSYGAIACASCKSFFNRSFRNKRVYECPSEGKCAINVKTRHICKKCRLNKCFESGMKKERLIKERFKNCNQNDSNSNDSSLDLMSSPTHSNSDEELNLFFNFDDISIDNNISNEEINYQNKIIENIITSDESIDNTNDGKHKVFIRDLSVVPVFKQLSDTKGFEVLEVYRLSELSMATKIFNYPMSKHMNEFYDYYSFIKLNSLTFDRELSNLVDFCKNLSLFNDMVENDKLAMVKYSCNDVFTLLSLNRYNRNCTKDYWTIYLDNENSFRIKMLANEQKKFFSHSSKLCKLMEKFDEIRNLWYSLNLDAVTLNLATAIELFNPSHPKIINREYVKLQQQLYIILLQRYLLSKYGSECEASEEMSQLMTTITKYNELRYIEKNDNEFKAIQSKYSHLFGSLQKEILDLK